jgi:hypothetical protein
MKQYSLYRPSHQPVKAFAMGFPTKTMTTKTKALQPLLERWANKIYSFLL